MFKLRPKQVEANSLIAGIATHILLYGGSRSAKTFTALRAIAIRAQCAPGSRHAVLGFRFNRLKATVILDTFPKMMSLCFPNAGGKMNNSDFYYEFPNGSRIWFLGLDSAERAEKVLGAEFATLFFNECSMIGFEEIQIALTRLAQKVMVKIDGEPERELRMKVLYDENPPKKSHWSYKQFIKKINPEDGTALATPEDYVCLQMNPKDNEENISKTYMQMLNSMSASKRRRFRDGEFGDINPNQLFDEDNFERYRILDVDELPEMVRINISVDPSGADDKDNEKNDPIGIAVTGLGTNGIAYVIEDLTVLAGPAVWGRIATQAYDRHDADVVVGEDNFGGAMVKFVIRTAKPGVPFKKVHASRGKHVRAEPISSLYADGRVRHVGYLREAEEELAGMTTHGYDGERSPNRADAIIWGIYDLFPNLTQKKEENDTFYEPFEALDPGCAY